MAGYDASEALVDVDPEDRAAVLAYAREHGLEVDDVTTRALDPVTVSLVLIGSALAIGSLVDFIDRLKGGQVIDLRDTANRPVYRSKELAYGLVLILTADGQVRVEVHEPKGMFGQTVDAIRGVLADVSGQAGQSIETAVRNAIGERAAVQFDPA